MRGLYWISGKNSSPRELSSIGTGYPDKDPLSLKVFKTCTWFTGGLGSAGLTVGLNDP